MVNCRIALYIRVTIVGVVAFLSACSAAPETFVYRELRSGIAITLDMSKGIVTNEHTERSISACDSASGFFCIMDGFTFVVPRNFSPESKTWKYKDRVFKHVRTDRIKLFGEEISAHRIEYAEGDAILWYLFAEHRGLVSFGSAVNGSTTTAYVLETKCGFGASARCTN